MKCESFVGRPTRRLTARAGGEVGLGEVSQPARRRVEGRAARHVLCRGAVRVGWLPAAQHRPAHPQLHGRARGAWLGLGLG